MVMKKSSRGRLNTGRMEEDFAMLVSEYEI